MLATMSGPEIITLALFTCVWLLVLLNRRR